LITLDGVFREQDPLLHSPAQVLLDYLAAEPGIGAAAAAEQREFLAWFAAERSAALDLPEGERDASLVEFSELSQHGTNEHRNIERRLAILRAARERWVASRDG
jgi:hypothetical protein